MQLKKDTPIFFVHGDGSTGNSTVGDMFDAVRGNMTLDEVQIFTDRDEAEHFGQTEIVRNELLEIVGKFDLLSLTWLSRIISKHEED